MKAFLKIKIIVLFLVCVIYDANAWYKRSLTNGGPNGYAYTIKNIDLDCNTTIICDNPGYSACPTVASTDENPNIPNNVQVYVYDLVETNVKNAKLNGSTQLYFGDDLYYVSWEFADADGYTSKIIIEH